MAEQQLPRKIEPIEGVEPKGHIQVQEIDTTSSIEAAQKVKFDEALAKAAEMPRPAQMGQIQATEQIQIAKPSPMDIARQQESGFSSKSIERIQSQALETKKAFEKPRADLMGNQGRFSSISSEAIERMNRHLEHADSSLQKSIQETGRVEVGSLLNQEKPPLERFLSFLTDGDHRVSSIIEDISKLKMKENRLSPEILLSVQMKLGFVQQELEFFTNVLNKALESTKTIMNVQI
ncbi:MAG: hypothetical protein QRY74_03145 [Chlamydia sp.]